jgi:hypothetical protein
MAVCSSVVARDKFQQSDARLIAIWNCSGFMA